MGNHEQSETDGLGVAILGEHQDGNQLGVSAGSIYGMKKTVFNSADFSTIVLSTYAVQH